MHHLVFQENDNIDLSYTIARLVLFSRACVIIDVISVQTFIERDCLGVSPEHNPSSER